ncbi:MAG: thioredoxin family protein [Nitrososphaerales archaeon]
MVMVEVLTSPRCAYCNTVKMRVNKVVEELKKQKVDVAVKEVDVLKQPEIRLKYEITSTPALAVNGKLVYIGVPPEDVIKRIIEEAYVKRD